ncbi:2636_t:CDS:1 [Cetraspora pellucida]|uniref:2636_t:CDS:1 n=1 Tax=Cetraspora pellucida TaxID=1433469 RepID=A0A9N9NF97_9GLOM|nr:2636_t:CDS:1 [Cetraspora pellucida]
MIINCWNKTGILSSVSCEEIEVTINSQDILLEQQDNDVNVLVIDLTFQNLSSEIKNQLNEYLDLNNLCIITEDKLKDSEIVEIVLDEENQYENEDLDDSDEEELEIPVSEGLINLNKFICFFEQQTDTDFKAKNLKIFQKYLTLVKQKYNESKCQTSIDNFFILLNNNIIL